MAVTVASYNEATSTGTSIAITKPTGLAVGDRMVAMGFLTSAPAGWTEVIAETSIFIQRTYTKIAEASDVAASDFSFNCASGYAGILMRITGGGDIYDSQIVHKTSAAGTSQSFTVALDTIAVNALIIGAFGYAHEGSTSATFSITGQTNPTWTQIQIFHYIAGGLDRGMNVKWANLATVDSLTAFLVTTSGSFLDTDLIKASLLIIPAQADATGTASLLQATPAFFAPVAGVTADGTVTDLLEATPTFFAPVSTVTAPKWTNTDKNSATNITNLDKS